VRAFVRLAFRWGETFQFDWSEEGMVVGGIYYRARVSSTCLVSVARNRDSGTQGRLSTTGSTTFRSFKENRVRSATGRPLAIGPSRFSDCAKGCFVTARVTGSWHGSCRMY
jgi:hypothetical protein